MWLDLAGLHDYAAFSSKKFYVHEEADSCNYQRVSILMRIYSSLRGTQFYIWSNLYDNGLHRSWILPLNVTFQFDMGSDDLVILETCFSSAATDAPITEVLFQQVYNWQRSAKKRRAVLLLLVVMKTWRLFCNDQGRWINVSIWSQSKNLRHFFKSKEDSAVFT